MDNADLAQERIDKELERSIAAARRACIATQADNLTECTECGDKLPQARIEYGFSLCVPCAEEAEARRMRREI